MTTKKKLFYIIVDHDDRLDFHDALLIDLNASVLELEKRLSLLEAKIPTKVKVKAKPSKTKTIKITRKAS